MPVCKSCHFKGEGKFCSRCGEVLLTERITLLTIWENILHTFTLTDEGFLYTLKNRE